jgi:hypothetical protein
MGKFIGLDDLETAWPLPLKNVVELIHPISYIDDWDMTWIAPSKLLSDGKTVPPMFWWLVGSPLAPDTLPAALIHDHYCQAKSRPYQMVHRVFGDMLLDLDIPPIRRKLMSWSVRHFGPRW